MQEGANQALARRGESIRMETRKGGEAKEFERIALPHKQLIRWTGWATFLWKGIVKSHVTSEGKSQLTDFFLVRPLEVS